MPLESISRYDRVICWLSLVGYFYGFLWRSSCWEPLVHLPWRRSGFFLFYLMAFNFNLSLWATSSQPSTEVICLFEWLPWRDYCLRWPKAGSLGEIMSSLVATNIFDIDKHVGNSPNSTLCPDVSQFCFLFCFVFPLNLSW